MTHLSPATAGGSLRERLIEDMTVRGFTDKTRKDYVRTVAGFADFLKRSPSTATAEDIRRFQIRQSECVMSFGRRLAYESLRRTNPRAADARYGVLSFG